MHVGRHGNSCEVEECGREIWVDGERVGHGTRFDTGTTNEEGNVERRFIHESLVVHPVIAEEEPVVRRVDYDGVFCETLCLEPVDETPDIIVNTLNTS